MSKPKLGRYLEWHGNRIRVVVRVSPRLQGVIGVSKLREPLVTRDPLEAEREKVDVVRKLKAKLKGEKVSAVQSPLTDEALRWQEAMRGAVIGKGANDPETVNEALDARVDHIQAEHGGDAAARFAAIAMGVATPIATPLDRWFVEKQFSAGYEEDIRRAVSRLEHWCNEASIPATIEAIDGKAVGNFIHERYIAPHVDVKTANKDIACLHSYWKWLEDRCGLRNRHGIKENPWHRQRLKKPERREEAPSEDKRPFTDAEVRTLLAGITLQREWEFSLFAALSGLRVHEIAGLRVKHCEEGKIAVVKSKTPSGVRTIPAHPLLSSVIKRRKAGKRPDGYLFEDLQEQRPGSKRDRSAPVSQAFTRERRRLGVDEKASTARRQSNIDFHSWRRWFIRRAVIGLEKENAGYSPWTIARVVGHKVKGGSLEGVALPLGMTMGHYPGEASWEAMTACVNAVALPENTPTERPDLVEHLRQAHLKHSLALPFQRT